MGFLTDLTDSQVAEMARDDYRNASESRRELEDRKVRDYRLYRKFSTTVSPGGGFKDGDRGPFGWSKVQTPLVYWVVETILPRVGTTAPELTATPRNAEGAAFAQAVQLRLSHHMKRAWYQETAIYSIKQALVFGDGPIAVHYDPVLQSAGFDAIRWWDWFVSPEATRWHTAEVLMHRTWHTQRSLRMLIEDEGDRLNGPVYDLEALDKLRLMAEGSDRSAVDPTYAERRDATGLGSPQRTDMNGEVAMIECWYRDGSRAVIDGHNQGWLLRVQRDAAFRDDSDVPYRPLTVLQNTPDLEGPYGISDAEMLEDHQEESSTLRNQNIDQATQNIHTPLMYDETRVSGNEVAQAMAAPGGLIGVRGPIGADVLSRLPAGSMSGDFERIYELLRSEAHMVSGVTDMSGSQMGASGVGNDTATGMTIIRDEANARYKFKLTQLRGGFRRMACIFHYIDAAMGSPMTGVHAPGAKVKEGQMGVNQSGPDFFDVEDVYTHGGKYDVDIDAGSLSPPSEMEQAQRARSLALDLGSPMTAPLVNWPEVVKMLVEAHGFETTRFMMNQAPPPAVDPMAPPGGMPPEIGGPPDIGGPPAPMGQPSPAALPPAPNGGPPITVNVPQQAPPNILVQAPIELNPQINMPGGPRNVTFTRDDTGRISGANLSDEVGRQQDGL